MDAKRALNVKASSVRRLAADYASYETELATYTSKLDALRVRATGDAEADTDVNREVRKQREFVDECQATMHDIRLRLTQAVQQLQAHMTTHAAALSTTEEWERALKALGTLGPVFASLVDPAYASVVVPSKAVAAASSSSLSSSSSSSSSSSTSAAPTASSTRAPTRPRFAVTEPTRYVAAKHAAADSSLSSHAPESFTGRFAVAAYGASQVHPGDAAYTLGFELGRALAAKQFHLLNGGYSGTMESTSAGARSVDGGTVEGMICPDTFPQRGEHGNKYLTHETSTPNIPQRIAAFLERADAFVVLPGSLGTLTELCLTWNVAAVDDLLSLPTSPILLFRHPWQPVIEQLRSSIGVPESFFRLIEYVDTVDECVERLVEHRQKRADAQRVK